MMADAGDIKRLQQLAAKLRQQDLAMVHGARLGHVGGELSAIDILTVLYFAILKVNPSEPEWPERDRFILSKGHAAAALYATLAECGFLDPAELSSFMQPLSRLNGHPNRTKVPGVESNTGPLGHGLPVAVGCAIGAKLASATWRSFVLTGDGELQEGSNWEAAMAAAHYRLDNLTLIIDRNRLQQGDSTERTMRLDPLAEKWRAFGWAVCEVDGHDHGALLDVCTSLPLAIGQPSCIIAHTHKGQGVSFMQDQAAWHHRVPNDSEYRQAIAEIAGREVQP